MKELQQIMNAKILQMADEGVIQKAIESKVEAAINSAIDDQFRGYGNMARQIEKLLDDKLKIDASKFDIPTYNEVMSKAISQKINNYFEEKAASRIMEKMDKLFSPLPETMTLVEFVNTICSHWKTEEPWDADDLDNYATVELESRSDGSYSLSMWKQKSSNYTSCSEDVSLYISDDGEIRLRHLWNPTALFDEDAFIVKAYASNVTLTELENFDSSDCELELKVSEY